MTVDQHVQKHQHEPMSALEDLRRLEEKVRRLSPADLRRVNAIADGLLDAGADEPPMERVFTRGPSRYGDLVEFVDRLDNAVATLLSVAHTFDEQALRVDGGLDPFEEQARRASIEAVEGLLCCLGYMEVSSDPVERKKQLRDEWAKVRHAWTAHRGDV